MCSECIRMREMLGHCLPEYTPPFHLYKAQEQYFIDGIRSIEGTWIGDESKPKPGLQPGQGVTVTDKNDTNKNHGRDGFVRDSKSGPYHESQDTNEYNVWFEPGESDYKYKGTQIEPNNRHIDPGKMPPSKA